MTSKTADKNSKKFIKPFAKKSFGQNFLSDEKYINKIIAAVGARPDETIIEIGPGRGALTEKLIQTGANIIAVELERDMNAVLKEKFADVSNFSLIEADALKINFKQLFSPAQTKKIKLAANLPYYISTAILQKIIDEREVFSQAVLMFQKEVVERITAKPNDAERGFLSVIVQASAVAEKLFDVPPQAFRPVPKVWSSVVKLSFIENAFENENFSEFNLTRKNIDYSMFRQLVSVGFSQRRKTIFNNLKNFHTELKMEIPAGDWEIILRESCIEPTRRAESLNLEEWQKVTVQVQDYLSRK